MTRRQCFSCGHEITDADCVFAFLSTHCPDCGGFAREAGVSPTDLGKLFEFRPGATATVDCLPSRVLVSQATT
jgi:hypothetical protein